MGYQVRVNQDVRIKVDSAVTLLSDEEFVENEPTLEAEKFVRESIDGMVGVDLREFVGPFAELGVVIMGYVATTI